MEDMPIRLTAKGKTILKRIARHFSYFDLVMRLKWKKSIRQNLPSYKNSQICFLHRHREEFDDSKLMNQNFIGETETIKFIYFITR